MLISNQYYPSLQKVKTRTLARRELVQETIIPEAHISIIQTGNSRTARRELVYETIIPEAHISIIQTGNSCSY